MNSSRFCTLFWITCQAILLATVTRWLCVPVCGWLLALCGLFCQPARQRFGHYSAVSILVITALWTLTRTAVAVADHSAGGFPWRVLGSIVAEALFLSQAVLIWGHPHWPRYGTWLVASGMVIVFLVFDQPVTPQWRDLLLLLAVMITLTAVHCAQRLREVSFDAPVPRLKQEIWLEIAALLLVFLLSWPVADQTSRRMQDLQNWLSRHVTLQVGHIRSARSYVRVGSLRSVLDEKTDHPARVALRVFSQRAPGYLRGRVHDTYDGAEWRTGERRNRRRWERFRDQIVSKPLRQLPDGLAAPSEVQQIFALNPGAHGPWKRYEVWNDPARGETYFMPLNAAYLAGTGSYVSYDVHQAIRSGLSTREPYVSYVPLTTPRDRLSISQRAALLTPLPYQDPRIVELAHLIQGDHTHTSDKIAAVKMFFQNGFQYSLQDLPIPPKTDPITFFLLERPPAHCEFFASATVVLLRLMNVPCRYVTGYVVREQSEYGDYWIARNRNAHAWVEAYDDQHVRWQIVETTPGQLFSDDGPVTLVEEDSMAADRLRQTLQLGRYWLTPRWRNTWLAGATRWLHSPLLVLLLLFSVGVVGLMPRTVRRVVSWWRAPNSRVDLAAQRALGQVENRLRKYGLRREAAETLHQFAARLRQMEQRDPYLECVADWYIDYANHRYGRHPSLPPPPRPSSRRATAS